MKENEEADDYGWYCNGCGDCEDCERLEAEAKEENKIINNKNNKTMKTKELLKVILKELKELKQLANNNKQTLVDLKSSLDVSNSVKDVLINNRPVENDKDVDEMIPTSEVRIILKIDAISIYRLAKTKKIKGGRNAYGNYFFSRKSVMEYKRLIEQPLLPITN